LYKSCRTLTAHQTWLDRFYSWADCCSQSLVAANDSHRDVINWLLRRQS